MVATGRAAASAKGVDVGGGHGSSSTGAARQVDLRPATRAKRWLNTVAEEKLNHRDAPLVRA